MKPGMLLFPFAVLFDAITSIRNRLYDTGVKPTAQFDIPVISVGNLSVGGTGKTPMVEHLIRLLSPDARVATLSRGYGRRTKGMRIVGESDNPTTVGDEPYQFYRKFGTGVVVAVGEDRALAIPHILQEREDVGVILLDDAFQHRRVRPSFQILLTDYNNLFVDDYLLPAGRLRESKRGAARADVVVVTKCPANISDENMIKLEGRIRNYSDKPVFFTTVTYGAMTPVTSGVIGKTDNVVLISGIASPGPLEAYLRKNYRLAAHLRYRDHHLYTTKDLSDICTLAAKNDAVVVTTEKDVVKMDPQIFEKASVELNFLPIRIGFLKDGKDFDAMVLDVVRSYAG